MTTSENFKGRKFRCGFNVFTAYRGTGGRVAYIAEDRHEVKVRLPLSWRTRNYVGTIYGGSIYASIDPIYILMLKIIGRDYTVLVTAAKIRFRRPGKSTLFADFRLDAEKIVEIKQRAERQRSVDRIYKVELRDREGTIHTQIEKTLYISRKKRSSETK